MTTQDALAMPASAALDHGSLSQTRYMLRRKFFNFLHAGFHLYDPHENVVLYMRQRGFKLKEDLRIFTGEDMKEEVLRIAARSIIDFSGTYDVFDSRTQERLGSLQRHGFKSMLKDEWTILDADGAALGKIEEDNLVLALVRRFLSNLVPQTFVGTAQGQRVFTFTQRFNPFIQKIDLDFSPDTAGALDRRMGLACALLMVAIEGRQQG